MKVVGQILELDPKKTYIALIKPGSLLAENLSCLTMKNGAVWITEDFDDVRFVENSDLITDIVVAQAKPSILRRFYENLLSDLQRVRS